MVMFVPNRLAVLMALMILLVLSVPAASAQVNMGRAVLASNDVDITKDVRFGWEGDIAGGFRFSLGESYAIVTPKVRLTDGKEFKLADFQRDNPDFSFDQDVASAKSYKWTARMGLDQKTMDKIEAIIFEVTDYAGLREDDFRAEGMKIIISGKYALDFSDIVNSASALKDAGAGPVVKATDRFRIEVLNPKSLFDSGQLVLDPYVLQFPYSDGYIERRVTGAFEVYLTSATMDLGNNVGAGDADYLDRIYMKFNTTFVDPWDSIINATFYARVSAETCGTGFSQFMLQNISDYGDLGESDWDVPYTNISIFYTAPPNSTGFQSVNVSGWIAKAANTFYRLRGSYEDYAGVDCFIAVNSNESANEPYIDIYYTDGSPLAPNITIVSPVNGSSVSSKIYLNVSSYGGTGPVDKWWYKLDAGANVTFVPNATFFAPPGYHCVAVNLNNTFGIQSSNVTCFYVTTYETALSCLAVPDVLFAAQTLVNKCNYTYARNSTPVLNASCRASLNDTLIIRRFYNVNSEEPIYNASLAGFTVLMPTQLSNVGGGAYLRCTNQTTGNFSIWGVVSLTNPFATMDGVSNITSRNFTSFIGSYSCDLFDAYFGVKNSTAQPISLYANQTWLQESLVSLGSPAMAYYGFYGGCTNCSGGNDSWFIGVNTHNSGYTYHGNLTQTGNWTAEGPEHVQWLFVNVGEMNMTFNASSGLYELPYVISQWSETKQFTAIGNCSGSTFVNRSVYFTFNVTGAGLPGCSIHSYLPLVPEGSNQTFLWSINSTTPVIDSYAVIRNSTGAIMGESHVPGIFSQKMNQSGGFSIECYVSNVVGNYTSSVSFSVGAVEYSLVIFYPPYAVAGSPTAIMAYLLVNGSSVHAIPNLTIFIDGSSGDMVWVPADSAYEVIWIPSVNGDYPFNVTAEFSLVLVEDGLIRVRTPFNITVRIWNTVNMTPGSNYRNEFSWIYLTRDVDPTLHVLLGRNKFVCPPEGPAECFWHAAYRNGTATVTLYEPGNYTMYIIGNNIDWQMYNPAGAVVPCAFCAPWVIQQRMLMNLGGYYLNGDEDMDLYQNPTDLLVSGFSFGILASQLSIIVFGILAIVFFFIVLVLTGSLKTAIAGMVLLPTIIYLALNVMLW